MAHGDTAPRRTARKRPSRNMQEYKESLATPTGAQVEFPARDTSATNKAGRSTSTGSRRTDTPHEEGVQVRTPSSARLTSAFSASPRLGPFDQKGRPLPKPGVAATLRFPSALEAQMTHQWIPCWKPSSGSYGVPLDDEEQVPHVAGLFEAFFDTRILFGDKTQVAEFRHGGTWTQDLDDAELVCWNIVQVAMNLHVNGAMDIDLRRMPHRLPNPDSEDAKLDFARRMFCIELAVRYFKSFAQSMMMRQSVELHLVLAHSTLWGKYGFEKVYKLMNQHEKVLLQQEWERRGERAKREDARSGTVGDKGHKRALSITSGMGFEPSPPTPKRMKRKPTPTSNRAFDPEASRGSFQVALFQTARFQTALTSASTVKEQQIHNSPQYSPISPFGYIPHTASPARRTVPQPPTPIQRHPSNLNSNFSPQASTPTAGFLSPATVASPSWSATAQAPTTARHTQDAGTSPRVPAQITLHNEHRDDDNGNNDDDKENVADTHAAASLATRIQYPNPEAVVDTQTAVSSAAPNLDNHLDVVADPAAVQEQADPVPGPVADQAPDPCPEPAAAPIPDNPIDSFPWDDWLNFPDE